MSDELTRRVRGAYDRWQDFGSDTNRHDIELLADVALAAVEHPFPQPDYEAAKKADCIHWPEDTECWRGHNIESVVDAALTESMKPPAVL